jgi:hypothetical protein
LYLLRRRLNSHEEKKKNLRFYFPYLRIFFGISAIITILIIALESSKSRDLRFEAYAYSESSEGASYEALQSIVYVSPQNTAFIVEKPVDDDIDQAQKLYIDKINRQKEEARRKLEEQERIRNNKIQIIASYLKKQNSPMSPYAANIYDSCIKYGTHYCKYFLSIAGVESGLGRVCPAYNAWGWGKKRFSGWDQSIPYVSEEIAKKYYLNGYNTFEKLAYSAYGPQNPEKWITNLYSFYNQIPL